MIVNACALAISPAIARRALALAHAEEAIKNKDYPGLTWVMAPAQWASVLNLYDTVLVVNNTSVTEATKFEENLEKVHPTTFMGLNVVQDVNVPKDQIMLEDKYGNRKVTIVCLAIPLGYDFE